MGNVEQLYFKSYFVKLLNFEVVIIKGPGGIKLKTMYNFNIDLVSKFNKG